MNLWILSFHKKVSPGCRGGEPPCKRNRFAESKLRTNNIWDYARNSSLQKTKVSLWAYAAHTRGYFSFTRKVSKSVSKGFPLDIPWGLCPRSNRKAVTFPLIHHGSLVLHRGIEGGRAPFCRKSKNQEVFGVSLVVKRSLTFSFTRKELPVWAA